MKESMKMTEINSLMKKVADARKTVRILCIDGSEHSGEAMDYTKAIDEECGIPSICIKLDEAGGVCLFEDEISSIEIIE